MAEASGAAAAASADVEIPATLFKKRGAGAESNTRKKKIAPRSEDEDDSHDSASDNETGQGIKRRRKGAGIISASSANNANQSTTNIKLSSASTVAADRSAAITGSDDATKQSNWFDEQGEKSRPGQTGAATTNRTYKELAHQTSFIQKNPNAPTPKSIGPQKAPSNVRTITLTDYAPDVCKDWKQTGYCASDSCKFLHERSDYKQGWQLDKEWKTVTEGKNFKGTVVSNANLKRRRMEGNEGAEEEEEEEDEDAMLQNIPFKCVICKRDYKSPVVTRCGHYFCEACALNRYRKEPSCAACGKGTGGIFNNAKKLKRLLERKREREERRAMEEGEREREGE